MPESAKPIVYVQKTGPICKVYIDGTGQPVPISSYDDQPVGAFPQTYTSVSECQALFPGRELVFIEKPRKAKKNVVSAVDPAKVAEYARGFERGTPAQAQQPAQAAPKKAEPTPAPSQDLLSLARTYLDKLQCAREYASEENQKILDLKIETAEEIIEEVFLRGRK